MNRHVAIYGNVKMARAYCGVCRQFALVIDGELACCNRAAPEPSRDGDRVVRMSEPAVIRAQPSASGKALILAAQGGACLYCDRLFGERVWERGRLRTVRLSWDHFVPWSHARYNGDDNFVAACSRCNGIKSNRCFDTVEDARAFIARRIADEGTA